MSILGGRVFSGGSYGSDASFLAASSLAYGNPTFNNGNYGFRVAIVPEPGALAMVVSGGLCLLAYAGRRWKRKA